MDNADHSTGEASVPGLERAYAHREPSEELEARVLEDFRQWAARRHRGAPRRSWRSEWFQAVAALLVFALGWGLGSASSTGRASPSDSPEARSAYMMLLWEGDGFRPIDDLTAMSETYASWASSVAATGASVSGEELGTERSLVGADSRAALESSRVGGYFVVGASSLDEARRLASAHPHVAYGGVIEIAPVIDPRSP